MRKTSKNTPKIRVGIVEDDRITRMLLVEMIKRHEELELIGNWGTAEEFGEEGRDVPADVLLVDLNLPQEGGASLIARIKIERPELACVVLTASADRQDLFLCLHKGAVGYMIKNSTPDELIEGIRAVANKGASISPQVTRFLVEEFLKISCAGTKKPGLNVLTKREMEILQGLASGRSPKDVANEFTLSYETVRAHLKKIYQKLHVNSRHEAVGRFVMEGGYLKKSTLPSPQDDD